MRDPERGAWEDCYMPDPGTVHSAACGICGTTMDVKRDCYGPTSYTMSVGGSKRKHDFFFCPHRNEEWHKKTVEIIHEGDKFVCSALRETCLAEANLWLQSAGKEPYRRDPKREHKWCVPVASKEEEPPKLYRLQNRYQDGGWEDLPDEIFVDPHKATVRAYELCQQAVHYGMVRVVRNSDGKIVVEFPAGGYQ